MAKANPLFIDSTKMTGDSIGTQFELSGVAIYEDEELFVLITNSLGEVTQMPLHINGDFNYQTKAWLRHQKSFTYQYVIDKGGQRFLQSVAKQARAQYAILDSWEPVLAEPGALPAREAETAAPSPANIPEHVKSVASLMEKFGF